jgi:hypothetical protein
MFSFLRALTRATRALDEFASNIERGNQQLATGVAPDTEQEALPGPESSSIEEAPARRKKAS